MATVKLFWNYVICGRGELPRSQRKSKQVRVTWAQSLAEIQAI
jgi:hypothetical protein